MKTLFTISRSWHDSVWLYEYLAFASSGDAILLIEDAVLGCHSEVALASFVAKCSALEIELFALDEDIRLRGIEVKYSGIKRVDYPGFAKLVTLFDKQVAW